MGQWVKVARQGDIEPGRAVVVELNRKKIAVFFVNNAYYAVDDTCSHASGPLSEGEVNGLEVTCPWHGAKFNIQSGQALEEPACDNIQSYPLKMEGQDILLEIS